MRTSGGPGLPVSPFLSIAGGLRIFLRLRSTFSARIVKEQKNDSIMPPGQTVRIDDRTRAGLFLSGGLR